MFDITSAAETRDRLSIVIADADPQVAADLGAGLTERGVDVTTSPDGAHALLDVGRIHPEVVLISADVPVVPAATLARVIRDHSDAAVIVGVGTDEPGEVIGDVLAAGVSALVARPYRLPELMPLLAGSSTSPQDGEAMLECGPLVIEPRSYTVRMGGQPVELTTREFELLMFLCRNCDRVLTAEEIAAEVWRKPANTTNTLAVHIRRLRSKLGDDLKHPWLIRSVRGVGYRLVPPEDAPTESTSSIKPSTRETTSSRIRRISTIGRPAGSSMAQSR